MHATRKARQSMGADMSRAQRIRKIALTLENVNEVSLSRVEAELGLTPRLESHDAGRPWAETGNPATEMIPVFKSRRAGA
jgi:hypothetical protein